MGTRNFKYERRCVIVEDDDLEAGNYPELEKKPLNNDRDFSTYRLDDYNDSDITKTLWIVMSYGYYEGACIDIIDQEDFLYDRYSISYMIPYLEDDDDMTETIKDLSGEIFEDFKHVDAKIKVIEKLLKRIIEFGLTMKYGKENPHVKALEDYLRNLELKKVNNIVDQIKKTYGYVELGD